MMLLLNFQLGVPRDMTKMIAEIQKSASWWHYMDDTWIIVSAENAGDVYTRLKPYLIPNDYLLITEITRESDIPAGQLPHEAWAWINSWKRGAGARSTVPKIQPPNPPPLLD